VREEGAALASVRVRRARADDVEPILDLLTEYDLPRAYFELFYLHDPTYQPDRSWVVEERGRLVAHLRVYERSMYAGVTPLRVGGIGNVITARTARGQGHAGRLLRAVIESLPAEGFDYSVLWTHLPELYGHFGWVAVPETMIAASVQPPASSAPGIRAFAEADLVEVMELYDRTNAKRSGAMLRSQVDWQTQLRVLRHAGGQFLIAREPSGELTGYARGAPGRDAFELHEVAFDAGRELIGRHLLADLATTDRGRLGGPLPVSLVDLFEPHQRTLTTSSALMGRVLNLRLLVDKLEPVWRSRSSDLDLLPNTAAFETSGGVLVLDWSGSSLDVRVGQKYHAEPLAEAQFAHLLLRGWDQLIHAEGAGDPAAALLRTLFPVQDFAIWAADAF
jgi:N-acetylglutamate synthase-like GNAT family acetyltransferase